MAVSAKIGKVVPASAAEDAGIPVESLYRLIACMIEVYSGATGPTQRPTYAQRQDYGPENTIPVVIDGAEVGRILVKDELP